MIIPRKAINGIMVAVAAAERYRASYPFWSSWKDPVLQTGLETVIDVTLTAIDTEGAVAMGWFAKDPLIPLKAAVKRDPLAKLRITAECDAHHLGSSEVNRDFGVEELARYHESLGEVVDAMAYRALSEAYALHPNTERFIDEAVTRFGWVPRQIAVTEAWLKELDKTGSGDPPEPDGLPIGEPSEPAERKQLELA